MAPVSLPHDAKAGPTKSEVRAVLLSKLDLAPTDHFVEVGSCTGAVTIEAARRAGRVTALERKPERIETTRKNLAENGVTEGVDLRDAEAPDGLPDDADALFLGGSRNYEAVLDHAVATGVDRVVMNVSRLEVAGAATAAFRERDLLDEVVLPGTKNSVDDRLGTDRRHLWRLPDARRTDHERVRRGGRDGRRDRGARTPPRRDALFHRQDGRAGASDTDYCSDLPVIVYPVATITGKHLQ